MDSYISAVNSEARDVRRERVSVARATATLLVLVTISGGSTVLLAGRYPGVAGVAMGLSVLLGGCLLLMGGHLSAVYSARWRARR